MHTETKTFDEGGRTYRITARCGFDLDFARRHRQAPYLSVTAQVDERTRHGWRDYCRGGCLHDEVALHFPHLAPLVRWHLTTADGEPTHYVANGVHHAEVAAGLGRYGRRPGDPDPVEAFKSTVAWGACPTDTDESLARLLEAPTPKAPEGVICELWHETAQGREQARAVLRDRVSRHLEARLFHLRAAFEADVAEALGREALRAAREACPSG